MTPDRPPFAASLIEGLGLRGLHVGSARKLKPGWLNTDKMPMRDADGNASELERLAKVDSTLYYLQHDSSEPFPLEDGSFDWVYSEHFIEHLEPEDTVSWLGEMRRLLRPGGHVRLSTPDLERYVSGYQTADGEFFAEHHERLSRLRNFEGQQVPTRRAWMVNQIFYMWGHRWIYDFDEVAHVAEAAGFSRDAVVRCSFQQGREPAVCELDLPVRSDESLYVEIERG
jgi:predicted SAM-dependent methyltransferase